METSIALARAGVSSVLEPGDSGYANAVGGFDLSVPFAPDVVIDAHSPSEVASAIAVVADRGQTLRVIGAGHGRLQQAKGGVAITLRHLDSIDVDPGGRAARVGAGLTWDPVLAATAPHGLAAVCGSAPGVGVVGYLLGGGIGPLQSSLGFSSDHVRSLDIVTPADGPITVSKDDHSDLFWALRGGKGGFGVVTSVTIDLLEVTHVYGGGVYFAAEDAAAVLGTYADWAPSLPGSSTTSIALLRLPPVDALPQAIRGRHVAHVRFASLDSGDATRAQLDDIRGVARPLLDTVADLPYGQLGTIHGDPREPMPVVNGTASLATLDSDTVHAVLGAADLEGDRPLASVEIRTLGPATRSGLSDVDAVGGRSTAHLLNVYGAPVPTLTDADRIAAVRGVLGVVEQWQAPVNLVNFLGRANDADAVMHSWTGEQHDRLDSVRARHDPDGLFPYARHGTWAPGVS
jgi:hypothetical protein